jgi:hypothetical protein
MGKFLDQVATAHEQRAKTEEDKNRNHRGEIEHDLPSNSLCREFARCSIKFQCGSERAHNQRDIKIA